MKIFKGYLLLIGLSLIVLTNYAQMCDITPSQFKGCSGSSFNFKIITPPSFYYAIMWTFGDGDSNTTQKISSINHIYDSAGTYNVCVTLYSNAAGKILCSNCIKITLFDNPDAIIGLNSPDWQYLVGNSFKFVDKSIPGKSKAPIIKRIWNFADGGYDSNSSPIYSYTKIGIYKVSLFVVDSNNCTDYGSKVVTVVDSTTSIKETVQFNNIYVYPNPFTESLFVNIPNNTAISEIQLLDLSGKSIYFRKNLHTNNLEIFRDQLPRGIYTLKIITDKAFFYKIIAN